MDDKFKWSKEFGDQETVVNWIEEGLGRLAPLNSTKLVSHEELNEGLYNFLSGRGTNRAQSLTRGERFIWAGNMIAWIAARWTKALGPKRMEINPYGEIYSLKEQK